MLKLAELDRVFGSSEQLQAYEKHNGRYNRATAVIYMNNLLASDRAVICKLRTMHAELDPRRTRPQCVKKTHLAVLFKDEDRELGDGGRCSSKAGTS